MLSLNVRTPVHENNHTSVDAMVAEGDTNMTVSRVLRLNYE